MNYYRFQFSFGAAFGASNAILLAATFGSYKLAIIFGSMMLFSLIDCARESVKWKN